MQAKYLYALGWSDTRPAGAIMDDYKAWAADFDARQQTELEQHRDDLIGKVVSMFVDELWEQPAHPVTFDGSPATTVRAICSGVTRRQGRLVATLRLLDDYEQEALAPVHALEVRACDND
jgi:hypothetical protein